MYLLMTDAGCAQLLLGEDYTKEIDGNVRLAEWYEPVADNEHEAKVQRNNDMTKQRREL